MRYELVHHPRFGHCAVAAEDIPAGALVVEEPPLLLIDYRVDPGAASVSPAARHKRRRAFMTLSRPAKASLLIAIASPERTASVVDWCHCPSRDDATTRRSIAYKAATRGVRELRARGESFPELKQTDDETLVRYSLIAAANAHSFDDDAIALLYVGCKVTHTCFNPNVAVSTRPTTTTTTTGTRDVEDDGPTTAKHVAVRDIRKGEILLSSYAKLTTMTAPARRRYLMDHKLFTCLCHACTGPDLLRGLTCDTCARPSDSSSDVTDVVQKGTRYPRKIPRNRDDSRATAARGGWWCRDCETEIPESLAMQQFEPLHESDLIAALTSLQSAADAADAEAGEAGEADARGIESEETLLSRAMALYDTARRTLTWRHYITASSAHLLLSLSTTTLSLSSPSVMSPPWPTIFEVLESVPAALESWYRSIGISQPIEELGDVYLPLVDALMTFAASHHDAIPRAMEIVQSMLLKVRVRIERRRGWSICDAMQEYYDDLVDTLNALVHGGEGEGEGEGEEGEIAKGVEEMGKEEQGEESGA